MYTGGYSWSAQAQEYLWGLLKTGNLNPQSLPTGKVSAIRP